MNDLVRGPAALEINALTIALTALGTATFVIVCGLLAWAMLKRRDPSEPLTQEYDRPALKAVLIGGGLVPTLLLVPLLLWTMSALRQLHADRDRPELVVEVHARQWWWEIRYLDTLPERGFVTANELHVPVGRRVELRLTSPDVIHSFWVPLLQGKTDHIPGRTNVTWLEATQPGVYPGQCAEFCGTQHANMKLTVVAQAQNEYDSWAAAQRLPALSTSDSATEQGKQQFLASGCALCHTVRGTPAGGNAGPDLTHVASRRTLAAGTLENNAQDLAGWMANPQAFKPGARMPAVSLNSETFSAIHRYLQQLR